MFCQILFASQSYLFSNLIDIIGYIIHKNYGTGILTQNSMAIFSIPIFARNELQGCVTDCIKGNTNDLI